MPWKEQTIEMERREFVERALSGMESKSSLCREFGISRPTGDKWIKRALAGETLRDRDKNTASSAAKIDPEVEAKIVACRKEHSFLGALEKSTKCWKAKGEIDLPCHSTINAVLHRHGLITPEASQMATPYKRFEMPGTERHVAGRLQGAFSDAQRPRVPSAEHTGRLLAILPVQPRDAG